VKTRSTCPTLIGSLALALGHIYSHTLTVAASAKIRRCMLFYPHRLFAAYGELGHAIIPLHNDTRSRPDRK
jgi:hypothetical protein